MRLSRAGNLLTADHRIPTNLFERIHLKQFDYGPQLAASQPQKHGAFGEFTFWREAFWDPTNSTPDGYSLIP